MKKKSPLKLGYLAEFSSFQKFSITAKWSKLKNSCSKLWLIVQLYVELGLC
jgi:hypothetical protein